MSDQDPLVVFTPSGKRGRFALGTPLLQAARSLGVDVDSVCGGRALCGRCQVLVMEGEFPKHGISSSAAHLSPFSATEQNYSRRRPLTPGHRLSCQAKIEGPSSSTCRRGARCTARWCARRPRRAPSRWTPSCACTTSRCASRTCTTPPGTCSGSTQALEREWQLTGLKCDLPALQSLQAILRKGEWKVTVAVHGGSSDRRPLAGAAGTHLRARGRRWLHHHRRPPVRP